MEKFEKEAYLYQERLKRLSTQEFWEEYKKVYNIKNLNEFRIDIYEKLEEYHTILRAKVESAMQKALNTNSPTELNLIRAEIETTNLNYGRLRFLLNSEEKKMQGMLNSIDKMLKRRGERPEHIFYHPKPEKVVEDISCPHCGKTNTNFTYGNLCQFCHELIGNPWKEHTICPECGKLINRNEIYENFEGFEFDNGIITCIYCGYRFDWKRYKREPEVRCLKYCINCHMPFNPNKHNWRKQRICMKCKEDGVDSFYLDNPNYQKQYRDQKKK